MPHQNPHYAPIADYGLIGNLHTTALVSKQGSIDFFCFPRFDSPSIFAKLLDHQQGGSFCVTPKLNGVRYHQQYLPNTNVLLTRWLAEEGMVEVTDFLPVRKNATEEMGEIMRLVKVIRGPASGEPVEMEVRCAPRFNYGRTAHRVETEDEHCLHFAPEEEAVPGLWLLSDQPLTAQETEGVATFRLREKESAYFLLTAGRMSAEVSGTAPPISEYLEASLRTTIDYWRHWIKGSTYRGEWTSAVRRSALTLKLLTSVQFGAPVAAATFGLPEEVGGERNWDYRYTWIRDAAFTMYAFIRLGFLQEAMGFMQWIWKQLGQKIDSQQQLQLMYRISGEAELPEETLDHWEGYRQSSPVRIGNGAYQQFQLDIYGELMDSIYLFDKYGEPAHYGFWSEIRNITDFVCEHWRDKDHGIWEVRGGKREFLYSRVMCWVAVDRAIRLAEKRSFSYDWNRWRSTRDAIFEEVYENFWDEELQAFVQYKGAKTLDASALLMPLVRFISPYDPRWEATLRAIEEHLVTDTMVYRYRNEAGHDGLEGEEGTFSVCSFWYVECLCRGGQLEKAQLYFEKMLGYGNHVGLFAEEISLTGEQLGNFPQAFTHLGLISAAFAINRELEKGERRLKTQE